MFTMVYLLMFINIHDGLPYLYSLMFTMVYLTYVH